MMLTGAYEGFIVSCHRHRDQAHGNCSGFRWEGRKKVVSVHLVILLGDKREREREGKRHTLFCHFIGWSTTTEVAGIGCDLKRIFAYKSNHVMWPTIVIMRKLILLILSFGVI